MRRAEEAGLDLVEVAPTDRPPVCRIMDYGKWKYQQKRKTRTKHAHESHIKEVRLRPKTDEHDKNVKVKNARQFLEKGDKVQFTMLFRGREMAHQGLGLRSMNTVAESLADCSKVESPPRMMGRRATMLLSPDRKTTPKGEGKSAPKADHEAPAKPAPSPTPETSQA